MADTAPVAPPQPPAAPAETPSTPAPVAAAPVPQKAPEASRLLAEATRRERAIQAEKTAWKAQRAKEEAVWKERVSRAEAVEAKLAKAKSEPLSALEALGISYEELSIAQLNDGKPGADLAIRQAEERVAALEKKIEADKAAEAEKAKENASAQEKQVLAQWHQRTAGAVEAAGEKYEMINALGYAGEVGKMVEEHYDATGEEVPWTVAAEKLEAHLQAEQEPAVAEVFKKLSNTKWFKSRYAPVAKDAPAPVAPPRRSRDTEVPERKVAPPAPSAPTISPKMVASYNPPRTAAAKTRAELRAKAEALLKDS